jgi:hypothetical protein
VQSNQSSTRDAKSYDERAYGGRDGYTHSDQREYSYTSARANRYNRADNRGHRDHRADERPTYGCACYSTTNQCSTNSCARDTNADHCAHRLGRRKHKYIS